MNKKIITIISSIVVLVIIAVAVYFYVFNNQKKVVGEYTKQYSVSSITVAKTGDLEADKSKFIDFQNKLEEAVKEYKNGGEKPNPDFFIEKARYADYLGQTDWSIEILNDIFNYYDNSSVAWNNLAKLYEDKQDYAKANEYYQKIIDTFGEKDYGAFYYYICTNDQLMGDTTKATACWDKYKNFGNTDQTQIIKAQ